MPIIVDKDAKRAMLLKAAAEVFSKKGFHATKMQEVADGAGVAKGTLYEYFKTKEDLFLAVYDAWMTEFEKTTRDRFQAADDALSRTNAIRDSAIEFYEKHAGQASLLLEFWAHALRSEDDRFLKRVQSVRQTLTEFGSSITQELVDKQFFESVDIESFTLLETGISDGIFLAWVLGGQNFPLEKAYVFRQSVIGLGLLKPDAREILAEKLGEKLQNGFL
ncbi:MAG TPA: TetR/AcrR family transcriptional regulator [Patescibacteria group bacterium]|nr:TetR/AcrR family transcriptional regulator [Patescibacteria group bacterium]